MTQRKEISVSFKKIRHITVKLKKKKTFLDKNKLNEYLSVEHKIYLGCLFLSIVSSCIMHQEVWLVFSITFQKKERKKYFLFTYELYIACVQYHDSLFFFVCAIPSYISVSHAKIKKMKFDNRPS